MLNVRLLGASLVVLLSIGSGTVQAQGDPAEGERVFNRCRACHSLEEGTNKIGPSLYNVIGREAGSLPEYNYSEAMQNADLTWTEETLDQYLADPRGYIPGNKMIFPGLRSEEERADVIAYLRQASQ